MAWNADADLSDLASIALRMFESWGASWREHNRRDEARLRGLLGTGTDTDGTRGQHGWCTVEGCEGAMDASGRCETLR